MNAGISQESEPSSGHGLSLSQGGQDQGLSLEQGSEEAGPEPWPGPGLGWE